MLWARWLVSLPMRQSSADSPSELQWFSSNMAFTYVSRSFLRAIPPTLKRMQRPSDFQPKQQPFEVHSGLM